MGLLAAGLEKLGLEFIDVVETCLGDGFLFFDGLKFGDFFDVQDCF
jgi:hypothetical protein